MASRRDALECFDAVLDPGESRSLNHLSSEGSEWPGNLRASQAVVRLHRASTVSEGPERLYDTVLEPSR